MHEGEQVTYFAETDFRNARRRFGIKAKDRTRHVYVIGKTGMGKSTLLENMAVQDIQSGNGLAFIDPHGGSAEKLLEYIPKERINDVVYFAPFDMDYPISFNVMEDVGYDKRHLVVSGLMSAFEKIWEDAWSARMAYILQNTLFALLEYPDSTLLDINRMLVDKPFRQKVVENITDPSIKSFWVDEFAKYTDRYTQEATPAIQNKVGQFVSNPVIRNIVGQPKSSFDIRKIMDEKKILIINLSKGRIGESNTKLLGSMLVTKIYLSAMSRADLSSVELAKRPNFYLYVDEFQSFANKSFSDILSEARKYKLNLTIAHQYVEQVEEEVRSAVFGNVGTMIVFRVGSFDAEIFEKEFAPLFMAEDIVNLGFAQTYLRLMIDGIGSKPFSATTLPPISPPAVSNRDASIAASRKNYGVPRQEVEDQIRNRLLAEGKPVGNPSIQGAAGAGNSTPARSPREERGELAGRAPRGGDATSTRERSAQTYAHPSRPAHDQAYGQNGQKTGRYEKPRQMAQPPVSPRPFEKRQENQHTSRNVSASLPSRPAIPPNDAVEEKTPEDTTYVSLAKLAEKVSEKSAQIQTRDPRPSHAEKSTDSGNKNALRSALSDILKEKERSVPEEQKIKQEEPHKNAFEEKSAKKTDESSSNVTKNAPPTQEKPHAQEPREVPEDVLRKILE